MARGFSLLELLTVLVLLGIGGTLAIAGISQASQEVKARTSRAQLVDDLRALRAESARGHKATRVAVAGDTLTAVTVTACGGAAVGGATVRKYPGITLSNPDGEPTFCITSLGAPVKDVGGVPNRIQKVIRADDADPSTPDDLQVFKSGQVEPPWKSDEVREGAADLLAHVRDPQAPLPAAAPDLSQGPAGEVIAQ